MRRAILALAILVFGAAALPIFPAQAQSKSEGTESKQTESKTEPFKPEVMKTQGSVTVEGTQISYDAYAGTIVVHPRGWNDVTQTVDHEEKGNAPEASMFYVAYFKTGEKTAQRPVTFLYNGGPGSSTLWLHMGAFGPRRVVTEDHSQTPAAPYSVINNDFSLLDASDLVFIDAPGTGFSRIQGKDAEKSFYGVDPDGEAFANFITEFLTKYSRWNSPKFLFGESYGTTRSAVLANLLETEKGIDLNGVILLSQILCFDNSADDPQLNPGIDKPYELSLPTFAATAWYHHKLPDQSKDLAALLAEVEHFAMTDYAHALDAGSTLPPDQRQAIAEKLHEYTGLPVDYLMKADLRINVGEFQKTLEGDSDTTVGRLDTRFSGPTLDPLSKEAGYDPQDVAIGSAYISAFNDYIRKDLNFGESETYKPEIEIWRSWNSLHRPPGASMAMPQAANVMPDLANAMKLDPNLKVLLNAGYFDLATPFFEGIYEMHHLPIPDKLQSNIEFKFYESGHMVYAHEPSLKALHDNVAAFIRATDSAKSK